MRYRYITIEQRNGEIFEGKPVYRIFNNKSGDQIGMISFYKAWNQYVHSSSEGCVFNESCLRDVIDFIKKVNSGTVSDTSGRPIK